MNSHLISLVSGVGGWTGIVLAILYVYSQESNISTREVLLIGTAPLVVVGVVRSLFLVVITVLSFITNVYSSMLEREVQILSVFIILSSSILAGVLLTFQRLEKLREAKLFEAEEDTEVEEGEEAEEGEEVEQDEEAEEDTEVEEAEEDTEVEEGEEVVEDEEDTEVEEGEEVVEDEEGEEVVEAKETVEVVEAEEAAEVVKTAEVVEAEKAAEVVQTKYVEDTEQSENADDTNDSTQEVNDDDDQTVSEIADTTVDDHQDRSINTVFQEAFKTFQSKMFAY